MANNLFDSDTEVDMALTALSLAQQPDVQRLLGTIDKLQEQVEELECEVKVFSEEEESLRSELEDAKEQGALDYERMVLLEEAISQAIADLQRELCKPKLTRTGIEKVLSNLKTTQGENQ